MFPLKFYLTAATFRRKASPPSDTQALRIDFAQTLSYIEKPFDKKSGNQPRQIEEKLQNRHVLVYDIHIVCSAKSRLKRIVSGTGERTAGMMNDRPRLKTIPVSV